MSRTLLFLVSLGFTWRAHAACSIPGGTNEQTGFDRILHGWTNYSTAFNATQDLDSSGDYASIATFYTPTQTVCPVSYSVVVVWQDSGNATFSFNNFSYSILIWSSLHACIADPMHGDVATASYNAANLEGTSAPDATTRGGRPAYALQFCLRGKSIFLERGRTYLVGFVAKGSTKTSGELFVPTSGHAGSSDIQAGNLVVGNWQYIADAGGLTVYDGQLATALKVRPLTQPRFISTKPLADGSLELLLNVEPQRPLMLQRSGDANSWTGWQSFTPLSNEVSVIDFSAQNAPANFYRAISQ